MSGADVKKPVKKLALKRDAVRSLSVKSGLQTGPYALAATESCMSNGPVVGPPSGVFSHPPTAQV